MGRALRQFLGTRQDVMGPAELSEWMSEIFPQGEARKSQLMEVARMAKESVPVIPRAGELDLTLTASQVLVAQAPALREASPWWARKSVAALGLGALAVAIATSVALSGPEPQLNEQAGLAPVIETVASPTAPAPAVAEAAEKRAEKPAVAAPERPAVSVPVGATPVAAEPKTTRRARRNEAARSGPGTVNIVTRGGWAEVYKGKKLLGSTPRRLTLPAGRHKLVLKPFGDGKPKTVSVRVVAGETRNVSIPLE
jgi:hypothetical protein